MARIDVPRASGPYVALADYDDADVLAKVKNVDGAGSGLDADLLDGLQATAFAGAAAGPAATYGASIVTNGTFTGSATGWTLGGGAAYGADNVSVVNGSTIAQTVNVVSGQLYQIEWAASPDINVTNVELGAATSGLVESWKSNAVGLVATTTGTVTFRMTFGGSASVDDVTVRAVTPSAPATTAGGVDVRRPVTTSLGFGTDTQRSLTTGNSNNAIGYDAQYAPAGVTANATTTGQRQTAVGHETGQSGTTQVNDGTALGYRSMYGADKATALGSGARADHAASVALGSDTTTTAADQVMVGTRDIEITGNATKGIVLRSPDGTRYRLTIANGGTVSIAAA